MNHFAFLLRIVAMHLMKNIGLRPNKLTNIWVPFIVGAIEKLNKGGRLAMVVPAELLQVSYASQLRCHLVETFQSIDLVTCNELIFKNAQQEVILLLAANKLQEKSEGHICGVDLLEFNDIGDLLRTETQKIGNNGYKKKVQHDSEKWLKYFLSPREITFMRRLRESCEITNLSKHASVDIGIVTGKNNFFVLGADDVDKWGLTDYVIPLVGRSNHLKGAIIKKKDWTELVSKGYKVFLFNISQHHKKALTRRAKRYIAFGEEKAVHKGYKCSIRKQWYQVPSVWSPDSFFFRQIHDFPRIVVNMADLVSTDTIHRMRCKSETREFASNIYTHLTAASAEIEGRSYGGGVLELEPTEAEKLLVPNSLVQAIPIEEIDHYIRVGKLNTVLDENDRIVLVKGLGLSERECSMLKRIWTKMMERRKSRKRNHH